MHGRQAIGSQPRRAELLLFDGTTLKTAQAFTLWGMMMQTVFVTGASGFIGGHVVRELTSRAAHVKCLVRPTSNVAALTSENVELVQGSIEAPESYRDAIKGCDAVIHLAGLTSAISRNALSRINGDASGALADACRAVPNPPRLVYVSSLAAAGPPPIGNEVRDESHDPAPISDYGRSKRLGETEMQKYAAELPITVVRPGVVYGPGDRNVAAMFRPIRRWRVHVVIGFRTPPLSLIFVEDLVQLILEASARGETLQPLPAGEYSPQGYYFACDDSEHPDYRELGKRIAKAVDRGVIVWPLWRWVGSTVGFGVQTGFRLCGRSSVVNVDKVREATARSWACSGEKARRQLDFSPPQSLDERLKETGQWFVENGWI